MRTFLEFLTLALPLSPEQGTRAGSFHDCRKGSAGGWLAERRLGYVSADIAFSENFFLEFSRNDVESYDMKNASYFSFRILKRSVKKMIK